MTTKRKKTTRLPRLTVLSMSQKELVRFSTAMERVASLAHLMVGLMTRLDACVTRLEKRSGAARKANATRRTAAEQTDQVVTVTPGIPEQLPPEPEGAPW